MGLKGRGLLAVGTVSTVCSLTAVAAVDSTYSDLQRGVLIEGEFWESGVELCSSDEDIIDIYWLQVRRQLVSCRFLSSICTFALVQCRLVFHEISYVFR